MDATPYLDRIADDEGLTDGLADDEAALLLRWLRKRIEKGLAPLKDAAAAEKAAESLFERTRAIARFIDARCYGGDEKAAEEKRKGLGLKEPLASLPTDAVALAKKLLAAEDAAHA
jgi:hypothetical protein